MHKWKLSPVILSHLHNLIVIYSLLNCHFPRFEMWYKNKVSYLIHLAAASKVCLCIVKSVMQMMQLPRYLVVLSHMIKIKDYLLRFSYLTNQNNPVETTIRIWALQTQSSNKNELIWLCPYMIKFLKKNFSFI